MRVLIGFLVVLTFGVPTTALPNPVLGLVVRLVLKLLGQFVPVHGWLR